ncbi:hypothetical protein [Kineosporia sp. A_224]|uniref:hypothetical protein n=1 Tax=Kineosporia sp. A_224 TaxID=1962180 RepID=UPI000B4A609D|nr:hypothetical protein [Kineosporia sp. A_224]
MTCTVGAVADWTAGYEAGYRAGYRTALAVLDDAAAALAALHPSQSVDTAHARGAQTQAGQRPGEPDHNDPADVAAYRDRIHASWGLTPPRTPREKP